MHELAAPDALLGGVTSFRSRRKTVKKKVGQDMNPLYNFYRGYFFEASGVTGGKTRDLSSAFQSRCSLLN